MKHIKKFNESNNSETKARLIHTRYIIELNYDGCEYHLTVSSDLKDIFSVDCLSGEQKHDETELRDVLWELFFSGGLKLD